MILPSPTKQAIFFYHFYLHTILLTHSKLYADIEGKGKNNFAKAACATRKGKAAAGTSGSPRKQA